jgi:hypothetical protein
MGAFDDPGGSLTDEVVTDELVAASAAAARITASAKAGLVENRRIQVTGGLVVGRLEKRQPRE